MKVLVTGGAGFIGSHIVEELLQQNHEVAVVDNLSTGQFNNIPLNVKFYRADIRTIQIQSIIKEFQPECVIHQAAQVSVSASVSQPHFDGEQNILGTVQLLEACVKNNVRKVVFASTAALYGMPCYLPVTEQHPARPISFYGLSKQHAESYIQMFSEYHGLTYTILRYSNVFGMRQSAHGEAGVIALFMDKVLKKLPLSIYGDGLQKRDFIFVKDVAKANVAALQNGDNKVLNISTGSETTILDVVHEFSKRVPYVVQPVFMEERPGDIKESILSNEQAVKQLNWQPSYTFSEGLAQTIDYYLTEKQDVIVHG